MSNILVVLPARMASTRLPRKLLQKAGGKTVLRHTYEAASKARCAKDLVVAVDDEQMAEEVQSFGGDYVMTPANCPSGTDRIAQVAEAMKDFEIFVNVQADEPEIDPAAIDAVADALTSDPAADMATAGTPIRTPELIDDPGVVKIVMGEQGRAVYFSRAGVPFDRDGRLAELLDAEPPAYWHHLGLYAYRRDFLSWFAGRPPGRLEGIERLEQLRAIEAGKRIIVARVAEAQSGIDTQRDLDAFRERLENAE